MGIVFCDCYLLRAWMMQVFGCTGCTPLESHHHSAATILYMYKNSLAKGNNPGLGACMV
jgi:hypothetical protein